jgi:UDP-N-acetylglucosamine--N-acetylmuramyl-(pentapeptide) pyrophosphoryl-undecaprenol N-acetylglucosamine transferase
VKNFRPDAIIGVGGYSSFPVIRFGQAKEIPTFIHEANSFAGKSNILLGKKAKKIFVATDGMEKFFPAGKIIISGNPVRANISQSVITRSEGTKFFGLDEKKKTIFAVGGSLGARSINEAISKHLDELLDAGLQLIWQTGKNFVTQANEKIKGRTSVWANEFITHMDCAYAAADVVVSRAGAMAVAELCVVKKPVIFVPYPHAAEDHQTVNAMNLVNKNAALMLKDHEALDKIVPMVIELAGNEKRQNELKENIGKLAVTDADKRIAENILKEI